ncbi:MAG: threonine ammonia-lyase [Terrisporobacter othiniensis]|uniref:L-threonine dehydratase catabolic TdcB n=1 Tax=Terrisporobacter hibernicus TaxID=2813371 RepID=A0AAX2ZFR5_9FIRM|nr:MULTISPECIES: threonine ammonia-lyase [Terrisporobacter]MDU4862149.1 threonine ammonia-lyase [Terrisporobacter othiniensis]MDU6995748.1 threonine ammonia-lyase [Terrisporobacter othiniensis]UEL47681.1 threonine ammonia-lyase [Terrisporobacter hibernicus]SFJ19392.1 threonine dehydratase [Terrisporobacter glycolicus]
MTKVTLQDIQKAQETIKDIVKKTDILESTKLSTMTGANVYYKCENLQKTGSFKVRGASNKIANLTEEEKSKGVIASSAGNHAQGVALSAKMNDIEATIVMPSTAPLAKVTATKSYGANVVLEGIVYDDAYAKAVELQKESGATFLHPFNDEYVIAGQGTIALEIFEQMNNKVDTILCPVGGGGIISGVAVAAKAINPNVKIIGVQTANIPSMYESIKEGKVTTAFKATSVADGISVKTVGDKTFDIAKELVDEVVLVDEGEIAEGLLFLMENQKVVAEGSGAVTTAAILSGKYKPKADENVVCIISGGNIDVNTLNRIIAIGLNKSGRRFSFNTDIQDKPGGLSELTRILSGLDANIIAANLSSINEIGRLNAHMILETFDHEHIEKIKKAISEGGFEIK